MRAKKIDNNQSSIVKTLRDIHGCTVEVDHDDVLVGFRGVTYWFEIKTPDAVSKRSGKIKASSLEPSQVKLLNTWKGHYSVVWSIEQILNEIGII